MSMTIVGQIALLPFVTWLSLSPEVVPDCEARTAFSRFADAVIAGQPVSEHDAAFVRQHEAAFVQALVAIWPVGDRRLPGSDGAYRDEMSALLVRPEISIEAMRPLLLAILNADGPSDELTYALLTRPDAGMSSAVRPYIAESRPLAVRIWATAILQAMGEDVGSMLAAIDARRDLTRAQREVVSTLLRKHRAREKPSWGDVEDLAYE